MNLKKLALTGLTGAVATLTFQFGLQLLSGLTDLICPNGWGGFGCSLLLYFVGVGVALVITTFLVSLVLRRLGLPSALLVAVFAAAESAIAFSPVRAVATTGWLWPAVASALIFCLIALAFAWSLVHRSVMIAAMVLMIIVSYFGLNRLADNLSDSSFLRSQVTKVDQAGFTVYLPQTLPKGYVYHGQFLYEAPAASGRPFYEVDYIFGTNELDDPRPFTVRSFKAGSDYNPPVSCSWEQPNQSQPLARPCTAAGQTATGETIYYAGEAALGSIASFVRRGETLVTLSTAPNNHISEADMVAALSSLKAYDGRALRDLQTRAHDNY